MFGNFFGTCSWLSLNFVLTLLDSCRLGRLVGSAHFFYGFALSLSYETYKVRVNLLFLLLLHHFIKPLLFLDLLLIPERTLSYPSSINFFFHCLFILPADPVLYGLSHLSGR